MPKRRPGNRTSTTGSTLPVGGSVWALVLLAGLCGLCTVLPLPISGESSETDPYRVEAAFLRNFAHYVTWPDQAFRDAQAPWGVCVLGQDPFGKVLDATLQGRREQGRAFRVYRAVRLDDLPPCQIVYVTISDADRRQAVLRQLQDEPVLTVGETAGFLREGGIIRLQRQQTVRMSVNLDRAEAVGLTIPTRMLEVAAEVVHNGVVQKVR